MKDLAEHVFPYLKINFNNTGWMEGRAILAPTNKQVNDINDMITDYFPGKPHVLSSSDELVNPADLARFNLEYLNSLNPSGFYKSSPIHQTRNATHAVKESKSKDGPLQWNQTHFQQGS